jgi:hypothetical protein
MAFNPPTRLAGTLQKRKKHHTPQKDPVQLSANKVHIQHLPQTRPLSRPSSCLFFPTAACHLSVAGNENGGIGPRSPLLLLQGRNKRPYHQQRLAAKGFRRSPRGMRQVRTERSEGKRSTDLHEQYLLHFRLASLVPRS